MAAVLKVSYGGHNADLAAALNLARNSVFSTSNGARKGTSVTWVAVVITDNMSMNETATLIEAQLTRAAGISIVLSEWELTWMSTS